VLRAAQTAPARVVAHLERSAKMKKSIQAPRWFIAAWGIFVLLWSIGVFFAGEFTNGKGKSARLISPDTAPAIYWSTITITFLIGSAAVIYGIRKSSVPKADTQK